MPRDARVRQRLLLFAGHDPHGRLETRRVSRGEELLGVGPGATGAAHLLGRLQIEIHDAIRRSNMTIASTVGSRHSRVESFHVCFLRAVLGVGKPYALLALPKEARQGVFIWG